jgi:heterodisulfide reductase subunit B
MGARSFKDKLKELYPWEEEKKKRKPERMGSIPSQTSLKSKVHSKPRIPGQEYLELYLMIKEKERLEKFGKTLGNIQHQTGKQWRDVKKVVKKAEKELPSVDEVMGVVGEEPLEFQKKTSETENKEAEKKLPRKIKTTKWTY